MSEEFSIEVKKVSEKEIKPSEHKFLTYIGLREGDIVRVQSANTSTSGIVTPNETIQLKKPILTFHPPGITKHVKIRKLRNKPENKWEEIRHFMYDG